MRRPRARIIAAASSFAIVVAATVVAPSYLRAASMMLRFADPHAQGWLARYGTHPVVVTTLALDGPAGPIAARRYQPQGVERPPGVVLLHGVHRLSIDEPRLVRFADAIAESGIVVVTPAVTEIASYDVDPASVATIGTAARYLSGQLGRSVGLIGMSFAGGLSLMTAADPRYADAIAVVLSIGGHDDLMRVSRYFAEDVVPEPDGPPLRLPAHPYGALVVAHANAAGFFPPEDVEPARRALTAWLSERWGEAKAEAGKLTPPSRELVQRLFDGRLHESPQRFLDAIARLGPRMASVSPHGKLDSVRARVFLLHGAADSVIPPAEARWALRELPPATQPILLVSKALGHVELSGTPTLGDEIALVAFMRQLVRALP